MDIHLENYLKSIEERTDTVEEFIDEAQAEYVEYTDIMEYLKQYIKDNNERILH